ncbi:MAG: 50S ribosomal protein L22 [Deltaproteobacteria bacterium]
MIVKAETKHIRIAPPKVRLVLDLIRNKDVAEAQAILINTSKRSRDTILKILNSAIANAKVKGIDAERLYVSKAICNVGPQWKRFKAAAFGRATPIVRRTSHIRIELDLKS